MLIVMIAFLLAAAPPQLANGTFDQWNPDTNLPVGWTYWAESKRHFGVSKSADGAVRLHLPVYDFVVLQQWLGVSPNTKYRIALRARGTFRGLVQLNIEPIGATNLPIDSDWNFDSPWREHSVEIDSAKATSLGVAVRLQGKGVVWIDDIRIETVEIKE